MEDDLLPHHDDRHKRARLGGAHAMPADAHDRDVHSTGAEDGDDASVTTPETIRLWRWHKRGGAKELASGTRRQYYNCSQQKATGCPARCTISLTPCQRHVITHILSQRLPDAFAGTSSTCSRAKRWVNHTSKRPSTIIPRQLG